MLIQSNANADLLPYRQAGVSSLQLDTSACLYGRSMQICCHIGRQGYQVYNSIPLPVYMAEVWLFHVLLIKQSLNWHCIGIPVAFQWQLPYRQAGVSSLRLSNPMPMQNCCHRERQGYRVYAYQIHYTLANWCLSECQSTTNLMLISSKSNANWLPICCQFTTNLMPIDNKSDTN